MPELREVFEMTTKQMEPDVDPWREQQNRQRRSVRKEKVTTLAVVAVIGLALVAWVLGTRGAQDPVTPATEPPTVAPGIVSGPFVLDLLTGEKTPLAQNLAGGLSYMASPDGTRLVYNTSSGGGCDASDATTVANIDGTGARTLQTPEGRIYCGARWSPDGTMLVYQQRNGASSTDVGNLFVQDLASGRRTQITDLELSKAWWYFLSPTFSPDGRNVIFHLPRSSSETTRWDVWSVPITGGKATLVLRNATFPMDFPDGKEIAFVSPMSLDFTGLRISIEDAQGSRRTLVEANSPIWWPTMSPDGSRIAYQDSRSIYVVDVSTGASSRVADGETAEWLDDHTLIVAP